MRKRTLSLLLVSMLFVGGAACSSDKKSDDSPTTTAGGGTGTTGGGSTSGNADVQAYCDQVAAYVDAYNAAGGDPAKLAELTDELTALGTAATDLAANSASLTQEDAAALTDCTNQLSTLAPPN